MEGGPIAQQWTTPTEGIAPLLTILMRTALSPQQGLSFRLYVNNVTPQQGFTLASYTEASYGGYNRVPMQRSDWTVGAAVNNFCVATYSPGPLVFTNATGPAQTIYGAIIVEPTSGIVYFQRRFTVPRVLNVGQSFSVIPRVRMVVPLSGSEP